MKKTIPLITVGVISLFAFASACYAQTVAADLPPTTQTAEPTTFPYTKIFIISAYYTPIPGQSHYEMGSYESDIRMNGDTTSADGTKVYPGMIAADKRFPFGTKMTVPGYGTGTVHDRGGAIKNNRLDLWMGSGEEGLRRALTWGMRTVEVTVYGIDPSIRDSVNFTDIPLDSLLTLTQNPPKYFDTDLGEGDEGDTVRELQFFLKKFYFFNSEATGYFGKETTAAVKAFQLSEHVIDLESDPGAGNFGPKSRYAFEAFLRQKRDKYIKNLPLPPLKRGNSGNAVNKLQEILNNYGFIDAVNGKFDAKTEESLMRFQIDASVIANRQEIGAGYYGPKTAKALQSLINESLTTGNLIKTQSETEPSYSNLAFGDKGPGVVLLQDELYRMHFLGIAPTGYFGKTTEHAVFKFQQAFDIVKDEKSPGAGIVGPQTSSKLREISNSRISQHKQIVGTTEKREVITARVSEERKIIAGYIPNQVFQTQLDYGSRGAEVEKLQTVLKRLGFFKGMLTTKYFGDITKDALITFQKNHGIEETGSLDNYTRNVLNQILSEA